MRKRGIVKKLRSEYEVNTKLFGIYDFEIVKESKSYYVKVLNITKNHQITVNSKLIWNIKRGRVDGIKFNTISSDLLNLSEFNKLENKIIVLTNKPYRLLKALNESDLKDISEESVVNEIFVTSDFLRLKEYISK